MKFAQILCLMALLGCAFSVNSCVGNPVVDILSTFIEDYSDELDSSVVDATQSVLSAFAYVQPETATLQACPDFSGKDSCCSAAMTDATFPQIVAAFFNQQKDKKIKAVAFIEELADGIITCGGEDILEDFFSGTGDNDSIGGFSNGFLTCRDDAIATISRLISGTMCSICAASDDHATYFDQSNDGLKIVTDATNWAAYEEALTASFTCFSEQSTSFSAWLEEKLDNIEGDSCDNLKANIMAQIEGGVLEVNNDCTEGIFTSECIDSSAALYEDRLRRFLSDDAGYTTGAGGLNSYNANADVSGSETDKDVDYISGAEVGEQIEGDDTKIDDDNSVEDEEDKDSSESDKASSQVLSLTFAVFLAVFTVAL